MVRIQINLQNWNSLLRKKKKKLWKGLQTERNIKPHLHVISEMGTPHLTPPLVGWTPYKYI